MPSRVVSFGGGAVRVSFTPGRAAKIVEFLYRNLPPDEPVREHAMLTLQEGADDGVFTFCRNGTVRCQDRSEGAIASWLLHAITRELAAGSTGGVLLHAAAASWGDSCLLLPGATGAGKTTLVAHLTGRGFGYMTDELTFIANGSMTVEAFARPLKIKTAGIGIPNATTQMHERSPSTLVGPGDILVAVGDQAGPAGPAGYRAPLGVIVFPRYQAGEKFSLSPLSPARAALRIMACALNSRSLSDHGFGEVARIAHAVSAYELCYGNLSEIDANLEVLHGLFEDVIALDGGSGGDRESPVVTTSRRRNRDV